MLFDTLARARRGQRIHNREPVHLFRFPDGRYLYVSRSANDPSDDSQLRLFIGSRQKLKPLKIVEICWLRDGGSTTVCTKGGNLESPRDGGENGNATWERCNRKPVELERLDHTQAMPDETTKCVCLLSPTEFSPVHNW